MNNTWSPDISALAVIVGVRYFTNDNQIYDNQISAHFIKDRNISNCQTSKGGVERAEHVFSSGKASYASIDVAPS
jgi:hypothetical protein